MTAPARNMGAEAARQLALFADEEYSRLYSEWRRLSDSAADHPRRVTKEHEARELRALMALNAREAELSPCEQCEGESVVAANRSGTSFEPCDACGGSGRAAQVARDVVGPALARASEWAPGAALLASLQGKPATSGPCALREVSVTRGNDAAAECGSDGCADSDLRVRT